MAGGDAAAVRARAAELRLRVAEKASAERAAEAEREAAREVMEGGEARMAAAAETAPYEDAYHDTLLFYAF